MAAKGRVEGEPFRPPPASAGWAAGIVVAGHGVASGRAGDPRFPAGTIAMQVPWFRAAGVDLARLIGAEPMMGTINLDLAPARPIVIAPEIALGDVRWSADLPPENFWLFRVCIEHARARHRGLIYMPDPATKPAHHQPRSVIELIAAPLEGISEGTTIRLSADPGFIRLERTAGI